MAGFELPGRIQEYANVLRLLYEKESDSQKLEIMTHAKISVDEDVDYDGWNDGAHQHNLHIEVPYEVFVNAIRRKSDLQNEISSDFNKAHNVSNEFVTVLLEPSIGAVDDPDSLATLAGGQVNDDRIDRLWGNGFRVFLSHRAEYKKDVFVLKENLRQFGVSSFVAHADIAPTREWQDEIKLALASMDCFMALMTEDFHSSDWTDQEVGFAVCRGVPIIPVRLGMNPYGFIGKLQALSCEWNEISELVMEILIRIPKMLDCFLNAFEECVTYKQGETLAGLLPYVGSLNDDQVERFISAYNSNSQVYGCYRLQDEAPSFLRRVSGREFRVNRRDWSWSELVEITR